MGWGIDHTEVTEVTEGLAATPHADTPFLIPNNVRLSGYRQRLRIMANRRSSHSVKASKDLSLSTPVPAVFSNREWAKTWKTAASELEAIRRAEIKSADTATAIVALDDAFRSMLASLSPRSSSGFVQMQTVFLQSRRDAATD
jgi:hypothetical protein